MKLTALLLVALVGLVAASDRQVIMDRKVIPSPWKIVGFPNGQSEFKFVLGLKQQNLDVLDKIFWEVSDPTHPEYQNFRTADEISELVATPADVRQIVSDWLIGQGASKIEDRGDNFEVTTTVHFAQQMFDTKLFMFLHPEVNVKVVRSTGKYSLPFHIMQYVDIVAGVSDYPPLHKRLHAGAGQTAVVPQVLEAMYNIPTNSTAKDVSQGVAEFGSGQYYSASGLQTFAKGVGISIKALSSDHIINPLPPAGVEGTLDIQYISTTGKDATNWYWTGNTWLYEWATAFSAASEKPEIVSISYGWSELAQCEVAGNECSVLGVDSEQYVSRVNTEFQKIGAQGVSLLCASGDSGANGRTDPSCEQAQLLPSFPAASPYITAVGATQLTNPTTPISNAPPVCDNWNCVTGGQETAVSFDEARFTSGGGFSNFATRPSYQSRVVAAYLNGGVELPPSSYFKNENRGFPDVASLGHNILIHDASFGGYALVGGTSASSPSFAGYVALLTQVSKQKTNGKSLGFLNPLLYKMYDDKPDTFRDITVGDNKCTEQGCNSSCKGFKCYSGWDPVTGLGVADVSKMLDYVRSM